MGGGSGDLFNLVLVVIIHGRLLLEGIFSHPIDLKFHFLLVGELVGTFGTSGKSLGILVEVLNKLIISSVDVSNNSFFVFLRVLALLNLSDLHLLLESKLVLGLSLLHGLDEGLVLLALNN